MRGRRRLTWRGGFAAASSTRACDAMLAACASTCGRKLEIARPGYAD